MISLTLREVAAACDGEVVGDVAIRVASVLTDSRRSGEVTDALFVALPGEQADGHRFVTAALDQGAVAALVQRADALHGGPGVVVPDTWQAIGRLGGAVRDRVDPDVVAVTGSVGKTTTKDLTRGAIAADRPTVAAEGSYNNELGVPLTLLAIEADTRALVVEIGARGVGHIAALTPLVRPDVAIVTAVAGAHLEQFGDLDTVAQAKGELVEALGSGGTAVLNADDERVVAMASRTEGAVLTYGRSAPADLTAADLRLDDLGRPHFTARTPWGHVDCVVPVSGAHNVDNALAALAAAGALGVALQGAAAGLAAAGVSQWRGAVEVSDDGVVVCNDAYNANPTSALAALATLAALRRGGGRLVAVLGIMAELGASAEEGHAQVGREAARTADLVVAVGEVAALAEAARAAGGEVVVVPDAAAALDHLRSVLRRDDAVLVKASRVAGLETVADGLLTGSGT